MTAKSKAMQPRSPKPAQSSKTEERIRRRAYELYEQRGKVDGFALDDWLQAELEILRQLGSNRRQKQRKGHGADSDQTLCPLSDLAARYTDDRASNFDIYLPNWLASHNKAIFGTLFVVNELIVLWCWLKRPRLSAANDGGGTR